MDQVVEVEEWIDARKIFSLPVNFFERQIVQPNVLAEMIQLVGNM